ncbi:riboflavin synthase [Desulfuribacillus alkaliarsenatis]|uniref:Riboflavin synthase n=1 Tax=Desulfuribacillus alkaliarsenatis TaxID=766136 RepID=A0A1E5G5M7_9FIRM|nr:riboflavin synthase [Desulfuribacillus alkaliarsenatis]OEF98491.1 riboflavin synthase subunit alpha [Desulfuribacillus alkaliarsenatis]
MFTGIVEEIGNIQSIQQVKGLGKRLSIKAQVVLEDVNIGDSIAVNGICLTVTEFSKNMFSVDVMPETIEKTNLKELKSGSPVNLERAMQVGGRFGGHIVSGHIDGIATIIDKKEVANAIIYTFKPAQTLLKYMVPKGSVTIDGISLTLVDVDASSFSISLIPHTKDVTILGSKQSGDYVNVECDMLAKYVEKLLYSRDDQAKTKATSKAKIDMEYLASKGML